MVKNKNTKSPTVVGATVSLDSDAAILALQQKAASYRKKFDSALAAIEASKDDIASQYAKMAAWTLAATVDFLSDAEAARALLAKVKSNYTFDEYSDFLVCKWLMADSVGKGPVSKMATISAGLRGEGIATEEAALKRIEVAGFAKTYEAFKAPQETFDDTERFVGAELVIRLRDGDEGIVKMTAEQMAAFAKNHRVSWMAANTSEVSEGESTEPAAQQKPDEVSKETSDSPDADDFTVTEEAA